MLRFLYHLEALSVYENTSLWGLIIEHEANFFPQLHVLDLTASDNIHSKIQGGTLSIELDQIQRCQDQGHCCGWLQQLRSSHRSAETMSQRSAPGKPSLRKAKECVCSARQTALREVVRQCKPELQIDDKNRQGSVKPMVLSAVI